MTELLQHIRVHAARDPQAVAIARRESDGSYSEMTYAQLLRHAESFARAFVAHAGHARIVPILSAKQGLAVAALVGAMAAGYSAAWLNPRFRRPQVERIVQSGDARLGVVDPAGLLALQGPADAGRARALRWWLLPGTSLLANQAQAAAALREAGQLANWPIASIDQATMPDAPELPAACVFTSGSTGVPKGVLVGRRDLIDRAAAEIEWFGLTKDDVLLSVLPFSFDVGLNQLVATLMAGATLTILDSWLPVDILRAVQERGVTGISAVPGIWLDFLRADARFERAGAHRSLRYVTLSGGDLQPAQLARMPVLADGAEIFKTYGQTEVFRPTCLLPAEFASRPLSVGRPFGSSRVYVLRDDGSQASPGETGEIVATGLGVMQGYLDDRDEQHKLRANPFRGPDDSSPTALFTGDLGRLDAEGYLYLLGRRDAMLKVKGNRVYPQEVVAGLLKLPGVLQAEVVGVRSQDGEVGLVAFVVLEPGAPAPEALRHAASARLPPYMVPRTIVQKRALPRTESGKPDYPMLAAEASTRVSAPP